MRIQARADSRIAAVVAVAWLAPLGLPAGCARATVAPQVWAKTVCSALSPWRSEVASLTQRAQQEIDRSKTPVQTKQSLTELLRGAEQSSEQARRRVAAAGVPAVDGGRDVATRFTTALTRARDAYGHTRGTVASLDAGRDKLFYDAVERAFTQLRQEYQSSVLNIDTVGPAKLHQAFTEAPECH